MLKGGKTSELTIAGKKVSLQTGVLAKQSNGSVTIHCGDTVLLATAVMSKQPKDLDFFPLTVEFAEKMYAAGKIPGGFFKREARPSTKATLTARLIDRPIRPCFPKGIRNDVQVVITVLSYDPDTCIEALSTVAASAALTVSDIPFNGPVGAAVVGIIDGKMIVNPSADELQASDLEIVVAGTKDAILMVEAGAKEVSEATILEAIILAHEAIKETITLQETLVQAAGKAKLPAPEKNPELEALESEIANFLGNEIETSLQGNKDDVNNILDQLKEKVTAHFVTDTEDTEKASLVASAFEAVKKNQIRQAIIKKKVRPDGRALNEIRAIDTQVGILPSTHGSAVFTRGETQSLGVVTLGSSLDEQILDGLDDSARSRYFFHYNFPPFSVGECGRFGTGRRELGHGALAERALEAVLPQYDDFPYTIRIVSEILESNGSSSMASVCSGSMALMQAGAPISNPVSGIAMGLLIEDGEYSILSDIQGLEDHYGDMDFKVAGTKNGITALQLDIKVGGLSKEILEKALEQAHEGRMHILNKMSESITTPHALAENAPKIHTFNIDPEKVGLVIGPGGKMIREIEEKSAASVVVSDGNNGEVTIAAKNQASLDIALNMIKDLTREVEIGVKYEGRVTKTVAFGAFIEVLPGKEGLLHISKAANRRLQSIEEVLKVGDNIDVIVDEIDKQKRINLVPVERF